MPIEQITVKDKEELEKIVMEEINAIENGLTVIYSNIRIDPKTSLDVLAYDAEGRLVVMQLNTSEEDNMFFEGLRCLNYIDTVRPMLKAAHREAKIDESTTPRLILLAPSFSSNLRSVVENTNAIEVDLYEWDYLQIGDKKGLYAHSIHQSKGRPKTSQKYNASEKQEPKLTRKMDKKEKMCLAPEPLESEAVIVQPEEIAEPVQQKKADKEQEKKKSIFSL